MYEIPLCFGIITVLMTFARRFRNEDPDAGIGVAGWGLVGTFILAVMGLTT